MFPPFLHAHRYPDVLGNKNIIDVSTPEKTRAAGLKRGRPYSNAVSSNISY